MFSFPVPPAIDKALDRGWGITIQEHGEMITFSSLRLTEVAERLKALYTNEDGSFAYRSLDLTDDGEVEVFDAMSSRAYETFLRCFESEEEPTSLGRRLASSSVHPLDR